MLPDQSSLVKRVSVNRYGNVLIEYRNGTTWFTSRESDIRPLKNEYLCLEDMQRRFQDEDWVLARSFPDPYEPPKVGDKVFWTDLVRLREEDYRFLAVDITGASVSDSDKGNYPSAYKYTVLYVEEK